MISRKTVDDIFNRLEIYDIVQDFVDLKKRGVNYIGLCPFHNEKTPSFTVSPAKNIYKCFGCGKGGNGVDFLMEHEAFSYPEALRYIARLYGITIEETYTSQEHIEEAQHRDALQIVTDFAHKDFQDQLWNTDQGKSIGLGYLKERGFLESTIKTFELGYTPSMPRDRFTKLAQNAGYKEEYLKELGLTTARGYDFFNERIIFPIHSLSGKPIAFAGRIMDSRSKMAKYMNSPENELYQKRKVLYGLHLARRQMREEKRCFLVEGYTDVMMLHQNGIENVVATSGTALTEEQIRLIKRYSDQIVLLFDSDAAGTKATLRAIDLILQEGLNVLILPLPEGNDPDHFIRETGHSGFIEYTESHALDFLQYKIHLHEKSDSAGDPEAKSELIRNIVQSIAKIEDGIKQHLYLRETAGSMDVPEEILIEELNIQLDHQIKRRHSQRLRDMRKSEQGSPLRKHRSHDPKSKDQQAPAKTTLHEKDIIRVLLQHGQKMIDDEITVAQFVLDNITDVIDLFQNEKYKTIIKHFQDGDQNDTPVDFEYFNRLEDTEIRRTAIDIYSSELDEKYSKNWIEMWEMDLQTQPTPDKNHKKDVRQALMRFKLKKATEMCESNRRKIEQLQNENKAEEAYKHLVMQQRLIDIRNEIAKEFHTIILK